MVENCETFIDKFVVKLNENLKLTKIINLSIASSAVLEKVVEFRIIDIENRFYFQPRIVDTDGPERIHKDPQGSDGTGSVAQPAKLNLILKSGSDSRLPSRGFIQKFLRNF